MSIEALGILFTVGALAVVGQAHRELRQQEHDNKHEQQADTSKIIAAKRRRKIFLCVASVGAAFVVWRFLTKKGTTKPDLQAQLTDLQAQLTDEKAKVTLLEGEVDKKIDELNTNETAHKEEVSRLEKDAKELLQKAQKDQSIVEAEKVGAVDRADKAEAAFKAEKERTNTLRDEVRQTKAEASKTLATTVNALNEQIRLSKVENDALRDKERRYEFEASKNEELRKSQETKIGVLRAEASKSEALLKLEQARVVGLLDEVHQNKVEASKTEALLTREQSNVNTLREEVRLFKLEASKNEALLKHELALTETLRADKAKIADMFQAAKSRASQAEVALQGKEREVSTLNTKLNDLRNVIEIISRALPTESWVVVENNSPQAVQVKGENPNGIFAGSVAPPTDKLLLPDRVMLASGGKTSYGLAGGVYVSYDNFPLKTQSHGKYLYVNDTKYVRN